MSKLYTTASSILNIINNTTSVTPVNVFYSGELYNGFICKTSLNRNAVSIIVSTGLKRISTNLISSLEVL